MCWVFVCVLGISCGCSVLLFLLLLTRHFLGNWPNVFFLCWHMRKVVVLKVTHTRMRTWRPWNTCQMKQVNAATIHGAIRHSFLLSFFFVGVVLLLLLTPLLLCLFSPSSFKVVARVDGLWRWWWWYQPPRLLSSSTQPYTFPLPSFTSLSLPPPQAHHTKSVSMCTSGDILYIKHCLPPVCLHWKFFCSFMVSHSNVSSSSDSLICKDFQGRERYRPTYLPE